MATSKKCVAIHRGNVKFVNLYWKQTGGVTAGNNDFDSLDGARAARLDDGSFICTIKITTQVEVV